MQTLFPVRPYKLITFAFPQGSQFIHKGARKILNEQNNLHHF